VVVELSGWVVVVELSGWVVVVELPGSPEHTPDRTNLMDRVPAGVISANEPSEFRSLTS
jgi:hypothetical protein